MLPRDHHPARAALSLAILLPAIFVFALNNPEWNTPAAATAYYSILAFICVTMAVSAMNRIRLDSTPSSNMMFAATFYASIVFSGAAIFYILSDESPVIHAQTGGIFLNLVALASAGVMMLLYSRLDQIIKSENSIWLKRGIPFITVALSIAVFVLLMIVVRMPISDSVFLIAGYIVGGVSAICYITAAILTFRRKTGYDGNDKIRLSIAFVLFAAATINHMLILPNPTSQWIISIGLMGLGFVTANVAISYTFLKEIGIEDQTAYAFTIITSTMVLIPFIVSNLIDAFLNIGVTPDIGATIVIHFGGAVLAGLSAYSLYARTRGKPHTGSSFIVFLLIFWMVSEIGLIVSHFSPTYGPASESLVPYVGGIIISSLALILAVRRVYNPTIGRIRATGRILILGLILAPLFLLVGEYARNLVLQIPGFPEGIVVPAMMLAMSYISLYALLTYIILEAGSSGGKLTFGTIGAGLCSVWIIIVILKANFSYGTLAWWAAEVFMLSATTIFSVLLLRLYLVESNKADAFIPRAAILSNLVSSEILTRQEKAIESLTEFTADSKMDQTRLHSISVILSELSHANEHAKYLEALIAGERFSPEDLEVTDLSDSFRMALKTSHIPETVRWGEGEGQESGTFLVKANALLTEVFANFFKGITRRLGPIELAEIDIAEDEQDPESHCRIILDMIVKVDDIDKGLGLVRRYATHTPPDVVELAYAARLVDLFDGSMVWMSEIASPDTLFVNAKIKFPLANKE